MVVADNLCGGEMLFEIQKYQLYVALQLFYFIHISPLLRLFCNKHKNTLFLNKTRKSADIVIEVRDIYGNGQCLIGLFVYIGEQVTNTLKMLKHSQGCPAPVTPINNIVYKERSKKYTHAEEYCSRHCGKQTTTLHFEIYL